MAPCGLASLPIDNAGVQQTPANRVGQSTSTGFIDSGMVAGTHFYAVNAQDVAGNISALSNETSVVTFADTTPPSVSMTGLLSMVRPRPAR